tara:strand:- start:225 stop:437 length:213 start_codon:yes stop_codon:yes gene_type:complete
MTTQHQEAWTTTEEQIDSIIVPAMKSIAKQCASHLNELRYPPEFIAVMLKDIAEAFESTSPENEKDCSCC